MTRAMRWAGTISLVVLLWPGGIQAARAGGPAPAQQFSPQVLQQLNATLTRYMKVAHVTSLVAGAWMPGRGSWEVARGMADPATGQPMMLDDHLRIGSITKSMIITAILELMDQGKLSLDDPISKYIAGVPNGDHISLRMLANMSSGLYNNTDIDALMEPVFLHPYTTRYSPWQLVAPALQKPPYFAPGKGFHYSNTNFVLLGLVVQKLSGERLGPYLRHHVYLPLGMTHTYFAAGTWMPAPSAHGFAHALSDPSTTGKTVDATHWNASWSWGSGAVASTLGDLHVWANAVGTGRLISRRAQRARLQLVPMAPGVGYGLGVFRTNGWIWHSGRMPGYLSWFGYLPRLHAAMALVISTDTIYKGYHFADVLADALSRVVTPGSRPVTYDLPIEP